MSSKIHMRLKQFVFLSLLTACLMGVSSCATSPPRPMQTGKIRFILSFDDGPAGSANDNPSAQVLAQLRSNPFQPNIKAIFFVQTRHARGGATAIGQKILADMVKDGHLLGLHAGTEAHTSHLKLDPDALKKSLQNEQADIVALQGEPSLWVRPPFLYHDDRVRSIYQQLGLTMVLTDLHAKDGVIHAFTHSFRRRSNLSNQLVALAQTWQTQCPMYADDVRPVMVLMHDVNPFTASHLTEYLQILQEEATTAGLQVAAQPFYSTANELKNAMNDWNQPHKPCAH